jgi:integrase
LTGQRRGEIAALRADYLADGLCALPASLTKNGRAHQFPVGRLATGILNTHSPTAHGFYFPARGTNGLRCFNGWSKEKLFLDKLSGLADWTLHDLLMTFATRLAEMSIAPHVIERLLNHISGQISGVTAVYDRARYLDEMRAAIVLWDTHLKKLLAG